MAQHQIDGNGADDNVFVDDRCPIVWEGPRSGSSPRGPLASPSKSPLQRKTTQATQNARDAALYTTKVKPIEGTLLQKLLKATVEEKRRTSATAAVAKPKQTPEEAPRKRPSKSAVSPGFHLPPGVGTLRPPMKDIPKEQPHETSQPPPQAIEPAAEKIGSIHASPAPSVKSASMRTNLVRITSSRGEEAFIEIPVLRSSADEEELPAAAPVNGEAIGAKQKNKKEKRKNKKQQKKQKKQQQIEDSKQHEINEHVKRTDNDAENAVMSGALPTTPILSISGAVFKADAPNLDLEEVFGAKSSRTISRRREASVQPIAESKAPRLSVDPERATKEDSSRAPSIRAASTRPTSFHSFDMVGEAWVEPARPQIPSTHSSSGGSARKAPFEETAPELIDRSSAKSSRRSSHRAISRQEEIELMSARSRVSSAHSSNRRSALKASSGKAVSELIHHGSNEGSGRLSHRVGSKQPFVESEEELVTGRALKTSESKHSTSHRSSIGTIPSIKEGLAEVGSSQRNSRRASFHRSMKYGSGYGNSPERVERDPHSTMRSNSKQDDFVRQVSASIAEQDAISSHVGSASGPGSYVPLIASQRSEMEKLSIDSEHLGQNSHFSPKRRRRSRHASTRSFSSREDLWEGPGSTRSSEQGNSRHSSAQQHETGWERTSNKCSVVKSVMSSVTSMLSKLRSEPSFEEIGEGWHDGSKPSDKLESSRSDAQSESKASSEVSQLRSEGDHNNGWEELERPQSEQSRSRSQSKQTSRASTHRSERTSVKSRHSSFHHHSDARERSGSRTRVRSFVGAPVHAVVSSVDQRVGVISAGESSEVHTQISDKPQKQRPTVFAGKGWITPHPLESSIGEPAPAIVLPSDAIANGATLSYEDWKAIQENGMRNRRNFSRTESDQSGRDQHKTDRYRFSGWEAQSWQEVEPATLDPNAHSAYQTSNGKAPAFQVLASEPVSELSALGSLSGRSTRSQRSQGSGPPGVSSSERLWERMEEGHAQGRSHRTDSVVSDKESMQAYSEWSQSHSRGSWSESTQR